MPAPGARTRARLPPLAGVLFLAAFVAGCSTGAPTGVDDVVAAEESTQPAGLVDLTVYYRQGKGTDAYLTPVIREVPVTEDLPRTALHLLIEGPPEGEPLSPVLPATTRVQRLEVRRDTAYVDLSREVVTDADSVGPQAEHEALALAAIADTLTEFPDISRVRLTVEGRKGGRFWGSWGLPEVLVRDERVIESQSAGHLAPQPGGFSRGAQRLGARSGQAPAISAVRADPSATFLRVTVEVTAPDGGRLEGPVPPSHARRVGGDIVLTVRGSPRRLDSADLGATFDDPAFPAARVDVRDDDNTIVVSVTPDEPRPFKLHTLAEPARVVLDIRR